LDKIELNKTFADCFEKLKIKFLSHKKPNRTSITKINGLMFFRNDTRLFPET